MDSAKRPAPLPLAVLLTLAAMIAAVAGLGLIAAFDNAGETRRQQVRECENFHVLQGLTLGEAEYRCQVMR